MVGSLVFKGLGVGIGVIIYQHIQAFLGLPSIYCSSILELLRKNVHLSNILKLLHSVIIVP